MAEDRDALLQHYRNMRDDLLAATGGLSDELMAEPSIDGWSVKDHLLHLALWDDVRAGEVERISAGHDSLWRTSRDQVDAYNALAYDLRHDLSVNQAKWEAADSHRRVLDAITSATERGLQPELYGEAGLRSTHEAEHIGWIKRWRGERGV